MRTTSEWVGVPGCTSPIPLDTPRARYGRGRWHGHLIADARITARGHGLQVLADGSVRVTDARESTVVQVSSNSMPTLRVAACAVSATRCLELGTDEIAAMHIATAVVGLATDRIGRSPADLLAKLGGLRGEGIDNSMYPGAAPVPVPPPTLTDDGQRDLSWIPEVLGVGAIALADHRSSDPGHHELARAWSARPVWPRCSRASAGFATATRATAAPASSPYAGS